MQDFISNLWNLRIAVGDSILIVIVNEKKCYQYNKMGSTFSPKKTKRQEH